MLSNILRKSIEKASGVKGFSLQTPENESFGDYSSNVSLQLKTDGKNPRQIAEDLKTKLSSDKDFSKIVEKIEIAGPGFLNLWLKNDVLLDNLRQIDTAKEKYGATDENNGKLAIVEYSSPNIAKPFTIGHLRSTIIGDAVAKLLEATGWKVYRDNHLGDWGTQFGKQIYAIKTWGDESQIEKSETPVKDLVALYVKFHEEAEKDPSIEDNAREWFKKLEDGDSEARRLWQKCIDWSWSEFNKIYKELGVTFYEDFNGGRGLGESFFEDKMKDVIKELEDKKLLKVGEKGAKLVFFKKDKYPALMILKQDGATLYATRDLATDKYRKEKYNPDLVVNEVGAEQSLYFKQIYEVEKLVGWYKSDQRVHVGHGLIRFKEGKMSTRKGNTIWLEDVLKKALDSAYELAIKPSAVHKETSEKEIKENTKIVGIGALKWNDLKRDPKTDIVFDWNEMLSMEGNSGPYLQYTVARTNSVLGKAKSKKVDLQKIETNKLSHEELIVLRILVQFSEAIVSAAKNYSPNLLANYLYNLAQKYNAFYNKDKIIGGENEDFRVELTKATGIVLKNGLKLLGIEAPERM